MFSCCGVQDGRAKAYTTDGLDSGFIMKDQFPEQHGQCRQGYLLMKISWAKWQRRYFYLRNGYMVYKEGEDAKHNVLGAFVLADVWQVAVHPDRTTDISLIMIAREDGYEPRADLRAETKQEALQWMHAIQERVRWTNLNPELATHGVLGAAGAPSLTASDINGARAPVAVVATAGSQGDIAHGMNEGKEEKQQVGGKGGPEILEAASSRADATVDRMETCEENMNATGELHAMVDKLPLHLLWGEPSDVPGPVQELLTAASIGVEFVTGLAAEFVPGARAVMMLCGGILSTCNAVAHVSAEARDAKQWLVEMTKLVVRSSASFATFPSKDVVECLNKLKDLIKEIEGRYKATRIVLATRDRQALAAVKERVEKTIANSGLQLTLELSDRMDSLDSKVDSQLELVRGWMYKLEEGRTQQLRTLEKVLRPLMFGGFVDAGASAVLSGTRQWAFEDFESFMKSDDDVHRVRVLAAGAGVGKTGIMCKLVHDFRDNVAAYFFCRHDDSQKRDPKRLLCTIAAQLTVAPGFEEYLATLQTMDLTSGAMEEMNLTALFDKLIKEPLCAMEKPKDGLTKAILIDALDECEHNGTNSIVDVLRRSFPGLPSWVRVFVTTRPEVPIMDRLRTLHPTLLEADDERNMGDVLTYFRYILKGKAVGGETAEEEAAPECEREAVSTCWPSGNAAEAPAPG